MSITSEGTSIIPTRACSAGFSGRIKVLDPYIEDTTLQYLTSSSECLKESLYKWITGQLNPLVAMVEVARPHPIQSSTGIVKKGTFTIPPKATVCPLAIGRPSTFRILRKQDGG
jgi:hypothetical protein